MEPAASWMELEIAVVHLCLGVSWKLQAEATKQTPKREQDHISHQKGRSKKHRLKYARNLGDMLIPWRVDLDGESAFSAFWEF